jgi:molybdopterin converting factor small subunit
LKVRLIATGRSYHVTGDLPEELELPDDSTVADALQAIGECSGDSRPLDASCLVAVSGTHLGTVGNYQNRPLRHGDELTLIAPVAGG